MVKLLIFELTHLHIVDLNKVAGCVGIVTASTAGHCKSRSEGDFFKENDDSVDVIFNIENRYETYEDEVQVIYGKFIYENKIILCDRCHEYK